MLFDSAFYSAILLAIAFWAVYCSKHAILFIVLSAVPISLIPILMSALSPPVAMQALGLIASVIFWKVMHWQPKAFVVLSLSITVIAYGISAAIALQQLNELSQRFPYISLEERLPPPKNVFAAGTLAAEVETHLTSLEQAIETREADEYMTRYRSTNLENLHEHTVRAFVSRPGFGFGRFASEWAWETREIPWETRQPGIRTAASSYPSTALDLASPKEERNPEIVSAHQESVLDFIRLTSWGYVKDRKNVAGFESHRFIKGPGKSSQLSLQTLDLVGLVIHDEPVVYISDNLPNMDELREAPFRQPDSFEAAGLKLLIEGKELFVRDDGQFTRMLGAVRSTKQCVKCHGGQRGDLLGAFSYTFTRK